jgi:hypothetical protein
MFASFQVRCVYRVIELGQLTGGGDYLMTHEGTLTHVRLVINDAHASI